MNTTTIGTNEFLGELEALYERTNNYLIKQLLETDDPVSAEQVKAALDSVAWPKFEVIKAGGSDDDIPEKLRLVIEDSQLARELIEAYAIMHDIPRTRNDSGGYIIWSQAPETDDRSKW